MAFSRSESLARALSHKVRYAQTLSKVNQNKDWKDEHEDWCKDAQNGNFVILKKTLLEAHKKNIADVLQRREKTIAGQH